jgi:hypothetical protein
VDVKVIRRKVGKDMPQNADKNYRLQSEKDKELGRYSNKDLRAITDGKNIRPKVIPGTQDTGSPLGALARDSIRQGTTARTGLAHRDTVKDHDTVARLADSQMATRYTAEQTGKMRAKLTGRGSSVGKIRGVGMAALLGMKTLNDRSKKGR